MIQIEPVAFKLESSIIDSKLKGRSEKAETAVIEQNKNFVQFGG